MIRRDPEQYVMALVTGRGYSTGEADRYDRAHVQCVRIMAGGV